MSISAIGGFSSAEAVQAMREKMFSKLDQDGSGAISKDEFKAGPADAPKGIKAPSNIDEIFSKIDSDGNGELSKDELESFKPSRTQPLSSSTMQSLLKMQEENDQKSLLDLLASRSSEESDDTNSLSETMSRYLEQILSSYGSKKADDLSTLVVA